MNFKFLVQRGRANKAGFTLIELLVAVGVTALMVSLMLTIVVNVMGGWSRSSGSLTSGNQARTVLDILSRDLQSAIFKRDGNVWLAASIQTNGAGAEWSGSKKPASVVIPTLVTGQPLPSLEDEYRFGQAGAWLRFIATIPGTNSGPSDISAPRAISYRILRRSVSAGSDEQSYLLHRSEVAPDATFTNGYNLFDTVYSSSGSLGLGNPAIDAVIANNVVDFGVRFLKRPTAGGSLELIFPLNNSDLAFAATSDSSKTGPGAGESSPEINFPDVVEVFVRVLTDEGAQQIANFEAGRTTRSSEFGSDGEYWWHLAETYSRVYSRRVEIKSTSL